MAEHYCAMNKKEFNKGTKEDPISLDDLLPVEQNGRKTIGFLRLFENKPRVIVYYDTLSAYNAFVINTIRFEPETRAPLNKGFVERITLYYQAITTLTEEQLALSITHEDPAQQLIVNQEKRAMFQRYMMDQATPTEILQLKISLFIDDTEVLHPYTREDATARLAHAPIGSWIIRTSSIADTDLITTRAISISRPSGIVHVCITQIYGYGFMISPNYPKVNDAPQASSMGSDIVIPQLAAEVSSVFPSFLDALVHVITCYGLNKQLLIGLDPVVGAAEVAPAPQLYAQLPR
jgi:hypothetical protein